MTRVQLELMTEYDQIPMVDSTVRGGLVQSCLRYCKANNQFLERSDDNKPGEETNYLMYLDGTSLYGYSMTMPLPSGNFKFEDDLENFNWYNLPKDAPKGYILECTTVYTKLFRNCLLCPFSQYLRAEVK